MRTHPIHPPPREADLHPLSHQPHRAQDPDQAEEKVAATASPPSLCHQGPSTRCFSTAPQELKELLMTRRQHSALGPVAQVAEVQALKLQISARMGSSSPSGLLGRSASSTAQTDSSAEEAGQPLCLSSLEDGPMQLIFFCLGPVQSGVPVQVAYCRVGAQSVSSGVIGRDLVNSMSKQTATHHKHAVSLYIKCYGTFSRVAVVLQDQLNINSTIWQ